MPHTDMVEDGKPGGHNMFDVSVSASEIAFDRCICSLIIESIDLAGHKIGL